MSAARAESLHRFLTHLTTADHRRVLDFYFSPEQRRAVLEHLLKSLSPQDCVILGCPRDAVEFYRAVFVAGDRLPQTTYVPVSADWHRSVCNLLEEALRHTGGKIVVVADFGGLVKANEVEGLAQWLDHGLRGSGAITLAQFEGAVFSESLLRRPIRKSAVLLFDGFYCLPGGCLNDSASERMPALADDSELDLAHD